MQAELPGDGHRCADMITGDHFDADARVLTFRHRRKRFLPGGILQADQPDQGEVLYGLIGRTIRFGKWSGRHGHHPVTGMGQTIDGGFPLGS